MIIVSMGTRKYLTIRNGCLVVSRKRELMLDGRRSVRMTKQRDLALKASVGLGMIRGMFCG